MTSNNTNNSLALGIDVGGTKIALALVDLPSGAIKAETRISAQRDQGCGRVLEKMRDMALALCSDHAAGPVLSVGVGVPELVDLSGEIASTHTFQWTTQMVRAALEEIAPTSVTSDVAAAAEAEAQFGAAAGFANFVYISVGTGISHSLVIDGQAYRGAHGHAILFGCTPRTIVCESCGATDQHVLEQRVAGPALAKRFSGYTTSEALIAAAAHDEAAAAFLSAAGRELGESIGHLVNVLDPSAIIVGGGLGTAATGNYWLELERASRSVIWAPAMKQIPIARAQLGPWAGAVGAAMFGARMKQISRV